MSGLVVRGLSKAFGGIQVARDINLALPPGSRTALIGPNGAGKTTFTNLLTGVLQPTAGQIFLDGREISGLTEAERVKAGIAKTFQITNLFKGMTVRENIRLPLLEREARTGRLFGPAYADTSLEQEIEVLLDRFQLLPFADQCVDDLAYGQQRLIEMALTLALKPRILILDEPAAGVPGGDSHLIVDAIRSLPADLAVLIIEHDMKLVFEVAKRIVVLVAGAILIEGSPEEISQDKRVRELYLGAQHG